MSYRNRVSNNDRVHFESDKSSEIRNSRAAGRGGGFGNGFGGLKINTRRPPIPEVSSIKSALKPTADVVNTTKKTTSISILPTIQQDTFVIDPKSKYPLQYTWVWSYRMNTGEKDMTADAWNRSFKCIGEIDSIPLFWQYYNNIPSILEIAPDVVFSFFKRGISPCWEDPLNQNGFSLIIYISYSRIDDPEHVRELYLLFLLYLIGYEQPEIIDHISGITVEWRANNKSQCCETYKFTVWFSNTIPSGTDRSAMINQMFKQLNIPSFLSSKLTQKTINHTV